REGGSAANKVSLVPAYHAAEGRIDIGDEAVHVDDAHAGRQGVFHGAAKTGFGNECRFGPGAEAGIAPKHQMTEYDDAGKRYDDHDQALLSGFLVYGHEHDDVVMQLLLPYEDAHDAEVQD